MSDLVQRQARIREQVEQTHSALALLCDVVVSSHELIASNTMPEWRKQYQYMIDHSSEIDVSVGSVEDVAQQEASVPYVLRPPAESSSFAATPERKRDTLTPRPTLVLPPEASVAESIDVYSFDRYQIAQAHQAVQKRRRRAQTDWFAPHAAIDMRLLTDRALLKHPCGYVSTKQLVNYRHVAMEMYRRSVNVTRVRALDNGWVTSELFEAMIQPRLNPNGGAVRVPPPEMEAIDLHVLGPHEQKTSLSDGLFERLILQTQRTLKSLNLSGLSMFDDSTEPSAYQTTLGQSGTLRFRLLPFLAEHLTGLQTLHLCGVYGTAMWKPSELVELLRNLPELRELGFDVDRIDTRVQPLGDVMEGEVGTVWRQFMCNGADVASRLHTLVLNSRPSSDASFLSASASPPEENATTTTAAAAVAAATAPKRSLVRHDLPMKRLAQLIAGRSGSLRELHLPGARIDVYALAYHLEQEMGDADFERAAEIKEKEVDEKDTQQTRERSLRSLSSSSSSLRAPRTSALQTLSFHSLACHDNDVAVKQTGVLQSRPRHTKYMGTAARARYSALFDQGAVMQKQQQQQDKKALTSQAATATNLVLARFPALETLAIDGPLGEPVRHAYHVLDALATYAAHSLRELVAPIDLGVMGAMHLAGLLNTATRLSYAVFHFSDRGSVAPWQWSEYERALTIVTDTELGHTERIKHLGWPSFYAPVVEPTKRGIPFSDATVHENTTLVKLLTCFPSLESLAFRGAWITDAVVDGVSKFTASDWKQWPRALRLLDLQRCHHITPEGIERLIMQTPLRRSLVEVRWIAPPIHSDLQKRSTKSAIDETPKLDGLDPDSREAANYLRRICEMSGRVRLKTPQLNLSFDLTRLVPAPPLVRDDSQPWSEWSLYPTLNALLHETAIPNKLMMRFRDLALGVLSASV